MSVFSKTRSCRPAQTACAWVHNNPPRRPAGGAALPECGSREITWSFLTLRRHYAERRGVQDGPTKGNVMNGEHDVLLTPYGGGRHRLDWTVL